MFGFISDAVDFVADTASDVGGGIVDAAEAVGEAFVDGAEAVAAGAGDAGGYLGDAIGWAAIKHQVPFITTLSAAEAIVRGLRTDHKKQPAYRCLQEFYLE